MVSAEAVRLARLHGETYSQGLARLAKVDFAEGTEGNALQSAANSHHGNPVGRHEQDDPHARFHKFLTQHELHHDEAANTALMLSPQGIVSIPHPSPTRRADIPVRAVRYDVHPESGKIHASVDTAPARAALRENFAQYFRAAGLVPRRYTDEENAEHRAEKRLQTAKNADRAVSDFRNGLFD